ncbi:MAG: hypothetical protein U9M97_03100 [Candidatus Hadarchaeota archaeon]|nr:hypothetical protein [Candidatus Hadarchaeota archaeon]
MGRRFGRTDPPAANSIDACCPGPSENNTMKRRDLLQHLRYRTIRRPPSSSMRSTSARVNFKD